MNTFDRFRIVFEGVSTSTKVSSVDTQNLTERYPDTEFGLVVLSGNSKLRALPCATPEQLAAARQTLSEINATGLLPETLLKSASARIARQAALLNAEAGQVSPPVPPVWWDEKGEGQHYAAWEAARLPAEKRSSAASSPALSSFTVRNRTVEVRNLADVAAAEKLLRTDGEKMSSRECRAAASAIVRATAALGNISVEEAVQKLSHTVRTYVGATPRLEGAEYLRGSAAAIRAGQSDLVGPAVEKVAAAYDALALEWEKRSASQGDLLSLVDSVDRLDQEAGGRRMHAHAALLLPAGELTFFKESENTAQTDGFEYTFGSTHLRASDIEQLAELDLSDLRRMLSANTVDALRDNPLDTFRSLSDTQRRFVARFAEEHIKVRNRGGAAMSFA